MHPLVSLIFKLYKGGVITLFTHYHVFTWWHAALAHCFLCCLIFHREYTTVHFSTLLLTFSLFPPAFFLMRNEAVHILVCVSRSTCKIFSTVLS